MQGKGEWREFMHHTLAKDLVKAGYTEDEVLAALEDPLEIVV